MGYYVPNPSTKQFTRIGKINQPFTTPSYYGKVYVIERVKVRIPGTDEVQEPLYMFYGELPRIQHLLMLMNKKPRTAKEAWAYARQLDVLAWKLRARPNYTAAERALKKAGVELGQPFETLDNLPKWLRKAIAETQKEAEKMAERYRPRSRLEGMMKWIPSPIDWPSYIRRKVEESRGVTISERPLERVDVYIFKNSIVVHKLGEYKAFSMPKNVTINDVISFIEEGGEVPHYLPQALKEIGYEDLAASIALVLKLFEKKE